jgi:hypothetical protein
LKAGENGLEKESGKTLKFPTFVSKMLRVRRFFVAIRQRGNANRNIKFVIVMNAAYWIRHTNRYIVNPTVVFRRAEKYY